MVSQVPLPEERHMSPVKGTQSKRPKVDSDSPSSSLWILFNEKLDEAEEANSEVPNSKHTTEMMVKMYLKEHVQPRHIDPLQYRNH